MKLNTRMSEKQFTSLVLDMAHLFGWRSAHFRPGLTRNGDWRTAVAGNGKGWPDLFLVKADRAIGAELKVPPNKLEPDQREWLTRLAEAGIETYVWTPDDLDRIERTLRGEDR